jgi:hypothetical protein
MVTVASLEEMVRHLDRRVVRLEEQVTGRFPTPEQ